MKSTYVLRLHFGGAVVVTLEEAVREVAVELALREIDAVVLSEL